MACRARPATWRSHPANGSWCSPSSSRPTSMRGGKWRPGAAQVPLQVAGEQAQEQMRPHPRHLQLHRTLVAQHTLAVVPVTVVARRRLVLRMRVHLRIQCPLGNRLLQIVDQAPATEHFPRVVPRQQLVQQLIADPSPFACLSRHALSSFRNSNAMALKHVNPDSLLEVGLHLLDYSSGVKASTALTPCQQLRRALARSNCNAISSRQLFEQRDIGVGGLLD